MSRTIVCDLDGVVYLDGVAIPGAGEALDQLQQLGYRLLFATNNSTKTRHDVIAHIASQTGFEADVADVLTSGVATAKHIAGVRSVFVVGEEGLTTTLRDYGFEVTSEWREAEAVVVGLDRDMTYEKLSHATMAVRAGARFVATNIDATYPTASGLAPGGGAIVAAIAEAADAEPEVCGKPFAPMRDLVRAAAGGGDVWVVGDRPETDLALAGAEGWTKVLVLTGVTSDASEVPDEFSPDIVVPSIADLPRVLTTA